MRLNQPLDDIVITEEELYEMARVQPKDSGLPYMIFVSTRNYVKDRHGPRIKISNVIGTFSSTDNFVVYIDLVPSVIAGKPKISNADLEDVFDWVKLNRIPLLKFWGDQYESDSDFYDDLMKL